MDEGVAVSVVVVIAAMLITAQLGRRIVSGDVAAWAQADTAAGTAGAIGPPDRGQTLELNAGTHTTRIRVVRPPGNDRSQLLTSLPREFRVVGRAPDLLTSSTERLEP